MTAKLTFTKDRLQSVYWLNKKIQANKKELEWLRSLYIPQPMAVNAGHMKKRYKADRLCGTVVKIVDIEREIQDDTARLIRALRDIKKRIDRIPDQRLRLILQKRYLNFEKWDEIAYDFDMDLRWVYRLHGQALQAFAQVII